MDDLKLPPLAQLRVIDAVCRRGGITRAAEELGVTHAAVSTQVSRLEEKLGLTLFDRTGRRVVATRAALSLAEAYRTAAGALSRAIGALSFEETALTVSLPRTLAGPWLATRFGRMTRTLPGLTIEVHADRETPSLGGVDVAVVLDTVPPARQRAELLYDERLTPLCSPVFAAEHRLRDPGALTYLPLISHAWPMWSAWFERAGLPPPNQLPAHQLADAGLALEAAAEGYGVALGCVLARSAQLEGGRLVAPFNISIGTGRRAYVTWSREPRDRAAIRHLCRLAGERGDSPGIARSARGDPRPGWSLDRK
jgi:LysR family glycine cleavage system transcriptional activator